MLEAKCQRRVVGAIPSNGAGPLAGERDIPARLFRSVEPIAGFFAELVHHSAIPGVAAPGGAGGGAACGRRRHHARWGGKRVGAVSPPGHRRPRDRPSPSPWLSTQIWTRIYRPYLEFLYLNNAYHFY